MKQNCLGFGFMPEVSQNHFFIVLPESRSQDAIVQIYERFTWDKPTSEVTEESTENSSSVIVPLVAPQVIHASDILKLQIPRAKWSKLFDDVATEFNNRLKSEKKPKGTFKANVKTESSDPDSVLGTPLEKLFGKELMVLLWAVEDIETRQIPTAIRNWQGLRPEERWWLYTMTNASTGEIDSKKGWRIALRYALSENPIQDRPIIQANLPFFN